MRINTGVTGTVGGLRSETLIINAEIEPPGLPTAAPLP